MNQLSKEALDTAFRKHLKRADTYLSVGQREGAVGSLLSALHLNPEHISTRLRLADIYLKTERHQPAREQVMLALSGHVESPAVALSLMQHLDVIGESSAVVAIARQLVPSMWDSAMSLSEASRTLSQIGAHELADQFAAAAVERDPNFPPAVFQHAKMDVFFGRLDSARRNIEHCLAATPDDPALHWLRSQLRLPGGEHRVDRLEYLLARATAVNDVAHLGYALHNELHGLKDFDRAWAALDRACSVKRAALGYKQEHTAELFDSLKQFTEEELSSNDGFTDSDYAPIFVVGLHRSGTTLTERIISGHSSVSAGGETYDITSALRRASGIHFRSELDVRVVRARGSFDYRRIGEGYINGMKWRCGGKRVFTEKLPSNFLNVGFIARALPSAKIVRLIRNPMDVGLSNLRTLFGHACPYSYNQLDFAHYALRFEDLMAHWHSVMPGRILNVDYQSMVDEPEASSRRIAEFCGLSFESGMVKIEERSDAVSTASSVMMREGIRKDRGNLWKSYERHLQPMLQALQQA